MQAITVRLTAAAVRRLRDQARLSGCSVSALIRERIEQTPRGAKTVHALACDLAGSLAGSGRPATNRRRKFQHGPA